MLEVMILISGGFFMAQTKRELVQAALDCKPVDRVPVGF